MNTTPTATESITHLIAATLRFRCPELTEHFEPTDPMLQKLIHCVLLESQRRTTMLDALADVLADRDDDTAVCLINEPLLEDEVWSRFLGPMINDVQHWAQAQQEPHSHHNQTQEVTP